MEEIETVGRALFLGLSAAFFIGYSLIATALVIPTSKIVPIENLADQECVDTGGIVLPGDPCYREAASSIPVIGGLLAGLSDITSVVGDLFSGFFQLISFQSGFTAASIITLIIFVPLGFINAFIIFTAVRGSS